MIDPKDAAALSAAFQQAESGTGADRAAKQLISQLAAAKSQIGLEDSEIFEAIAEGTSAKDPLYYTARILQYVCEYVSPYAVPVLLGLGFWKSFELAQQLTDVLGNWWNEMFPDAPAKGGAPQVAPKKDGRKAYFMAGMNANSVVPALQTGLLAVLPPYASLAIGRIINATAPRVAVPPAAAVGYNPYSAGYAPQPPMQPQPGYQTGGYYPAPQQPQPQGPNAWETIGTGLANKLGGRVIDSLFGGSGQALADNGGLWFDGRNPARDERVIARDARPSGVAPTNLGLAQ